jgi:hypothetical protein
MSGPPTRASSPRASMTAAATEGLRSRALGRRTLSIERTYGFVSRWEELTRRVKSVALSSLLRL